MTNDNPYVGLRPYSSDDSKLFHGRTRESRDVSAFWQGNRLLVLYGPSGIGKTSLLRAGVIPHLDYQSVDVLPVGRVIGSFGTSKQNPYVRALLSSWAQDDPAMNLHDASLDSFLTGRTVQRDRHGDPLPVLAAIDQFEELFNDPQYQQRHVDQFIEHLASALGALPSLRLLISIREDALARLLPYEIKLTRRYRARFEVPRLTIAAALDAVKRPLISISTGRSFAPGAAEKLVDHLKTNGNVNQVEPIRLQLACAELWRWLPQDVTTITESQLPPYRDINQAIAELCARDITEVAKEHHVSERTLYLWLDQIFITELDSRRVVFEESVVARMVPIPILNTLVERGVLESGEHSGSRWYALQYDRLIKPIRLTCHQLRESDPWAQAESELYLGNDYFSHNQLDAAQEHYQEAVKHFGVLGDDAAVGRSLAATGRLLLAKGEYKEAIEELQAAAERSTGDLAIKVDLARAWRSMGDLRAASSVIREVVDTRPDPDALALYGQIHAEQNDPDSALQYLDKQLLLRPENGRRAELLSARALVLASLERINDALNEANAAVENAPENGPVLLRASEVNRAAGDLTLAAELLRRAIAAQQPALPGYRLPEVHRRLELTVAG